MASILVTYATRYGSTREVAEEVAKRVRAHGQAVDVQSVDEVDSLEGFDAVVLGSGLYVGGMLKDAYTFLNRHQAILETLPVAVFVLGPLTGDQVRDDHHKQLDDALAKVAWLKPVAAEEFVGKYDPAHLRFTDKLASVLPVSPLYHETAHDERDWAAIDGWADHLTDDLHVQV